MSVLVIGDSHVGGLERYLRSLIPGVVVSGIDSTRTDQWTNFNPGSSDTVVVVLGTNDISSGLSPSRTATAAKQIVQRAGGRRVLWAMPPLFGTGSITLNAIRASGAEIIEGLSLPMANAWHPTSQGYQQWANVIAQRVNAIQMVQVSSAPIPTYTWANFALPPIDASNFNPDAVPDTSSIQTALVVLLGFLFLRRFLF